MQQMIFIADFIACSTKAPNTTGSDHVYNTLELLMMGIVLPETCWACNKICNKYHLVHLVGILFPNSIGKVKPFQATMADGIPTDLPNSYVPDGTAQAEFERRNWVSVYIFNCTCLSDGNPNSKTREPDRQLHDHSAVCVIARVAIHLSLPSAAVKNTWSYMAIMAQCRINHKDKFTFTNITHRILYHSYRAYSYIHKQLHLKNTIHNIKVFYSPTNAQVNCLKNSIKIYIKIDPTFHCFTVHFHSLSFIHTNSCTFSYNYVSVF